MLSYELLKIMDKELYARKIKQLTDEKLKELVQLKTKGNHSIIELAEKEAVDRGIDLATIDVRIKETGQEKNRTKEDKGINWMWVITNFFNEL